MNKTLPKPKKTLKSFILENDAKITDKVGAKIAITVAFIGLNIMANADDANAKGHKNHTNHTNNLNVDARNDFGNTGYHVGNNFYEQDKVVSKIDGKTIQSTHGNHYNHKDGGGQGGCSSGFQDKASGKAPSVSGSEGVMPRTDLEILRDSNDDLNR